MSQDLNPFLEQIRSSSASTALLLGFSLTFVLQIRTSNEKSPDLNVAANCFLLASAFLFVSLMSEQSIIPDFQTVTREFGIPDYNQSSAESLGRRAIASYLAVSLTKGLGVLIFWTGMLYVGVFHSIRMAVAIIIITTTLGVAGFIIHRL
jgi:hypothetical protein